MIYYGIAALVIAIIVVGLFLKKGGGSLEEGGGGLKQGGGRGNEAWPPGMVNERGRRLCPTPMHALAEIGRTGDRLRQLYGSGPSGATPRQNPDLNRAMIVYSSTLGMFMASGPDHVLALKKSYLDLVPMLRNDIVTMADYIIADPGIDGLVLCIYQELKKSPDGELKAAGESLAQGVKAAKDLLKMGS